MQSTSVIPLQYFSLTHPRTVSKQPQRMFGRPTVPLRLVSSVTGPPPWPSSTNTKCVTSKETQEALTVFWSLASTPPAPSTPVSWYPRRRSWREGASLWQAWGSEVKYRRVREADQVAEDSGSGVWGYHPGSHCFLLHKRSAKAASLSFLGL